METAAAARNPLAGSAPASPDIRHSGSQGDLRLPSESPATELETLLETAGAIKDFFLSINLSSVGTGRMWYDKENHILLPLSNWSSNYYWQTFVNLGSDRTNFAKVREGFFFQEAKLSAIKQRIDNLDLDVEDCDFSSKLLKELTKIAKILDGVAKKGLKQLADNYVQLGETDNASSIADFDTNIGTLVSEAKQQLEEKLRGRVQALDDSVNLESHAIKARALLAKLNLYRGALRNIVADRASGLSIPRELIEHCLTDASDVSELDSESVKDAAKVLSIPSFAQPIPTQGGASAWQPVRLVRCGGQVDQQKGIWGTCEQEEGDGNIPNVFHRVNPDTKQIVIGCGALDAPSKAEELAMVMKEAVRGATEKGGADCTRWVVHQLNSFTQEAHLIREAHSHVYLNQELFQKVLENPSTSVLHFNTCFNASTLLYWEDPQSLIGVNLDNLGKLAQFVFNDMFALLQGKDILVQMKALQEQFAAVTQLANYIHQLKKQLKDKEQKGSHDPSVATDVAPKPIDKGVEVDKRESQPREDLDELEEDWEEVPPFSLSHLTKKELVERLDHELPRMKELLADLKKGLVQQAQFMFESRFRDSASEWHKATLIAEVFSEILAVQLKLPEARQHSRITEVELFLLLYRLLKINPIIICYRGLDRSGAVRALETTQAIIVKELYEEALIKMPEHSEKGQKAAWASAWRTLFDLILNLDANRDELDSLTNELVASAKGLLEKDLVSALTPSTYKPSINVRQALFAWIDAKYPPVSEGRGALLKLTQRYLEVNAAELLRSEAEKVLDSTGVIGYKYHHDASFPKYLFSNPHPPQRWPMIAFVGHRAIKLLDYTPGSWRSRSSSNITLEAMQLFLRASKLRND